MRAPKWNREEDDRLKRWLEREDVLEGAQRMRDAREREKRAGGMGIPSPPPLPTDGERAAAAEATATANQKIADQATESVKWWRGCAVIAVGAFFLSRC